MASSSHFETSPVRLLCSVMCSSGYQIYLIWLQKSKQAVGLVGGNLLWTIWASLLRNFQHGYRFCHWLWFSCLPFDKTPTRATSTNKNIPQEANTHPQINKYIYTYAYPIRRCGMSQPLRAYFSPLPVFPKAHPVSQAAELCNPSTSEAREACQLSWHMA